MTGTVDDVDLSMLDRADRMIVACSSRRITRACSKRFRTGLTRSCSMGRPEAEPAHRAARDRGRAAVGRRPTGDLVDGAALSDLGYDRHEVLHMLMSVVSDELFHAMQPDAAPQDSGRNRAALAALPESWEVQRETPSPNRAERRAQQGTQRRRPR